MTYHHNDKQLLYFKMEDYEGHNYIGDIFQLTSNGKIRRPKEFIYNVTNYIKDIDVNTFDEQGWSLLHIASNNGLLSIVQLLLDNGADVNIRKRCHSIFCCEFNQREMDQFGNLTKCRWTPLMLAMSNEHYEVATLLLQHNADPNVWKGTKYNPLVMCYDESMIHTLVKHGADINTRDEHGNPLILCHNYRRLKTLISCKADINIGNDGDTALSLACRYNNYETVKLLLRHGAIVDDVIINNTKDHKITSLLQEYL